MLRFGTTPSLAGTFGYLWMEPADRTGGSTAPVLLGSGWTTVAEDLLLLVHPALRPTGTVAAGNHPAVDEAVARYDDGELEAIDTVAVLQRSGPFLQAARQALRRVRPGRPVTYTELARAAGRPAAVRAAAAACAGNAAALFVPCHRIVRRDGGLGGFRYGVDIKRQLLAHESAGG